MENYVLATSVDDYVTIRNISCFKTDKNFRKTQQLFKNPQVALCNGRIQIEGLTKNIGLVIEKLGRKFEQLYRQYL